MNKMTELIDSYLAEINFQIEEEEADLKGIFKEIEQLAYVARTNDVDMTHEIERQIIVLHTTRNNLDRLYNDRKMLAKIRKEWENDD